MNKKLFTLIALTTIIISGCTAKVTNNSQESTPEATTTESSLETTTGVTLAEFNRAEYDQAIADGKKVFIDFHASWCTVCAANAPRIKAALKQYPNNDLVAFRADFDTETQLKQELNVRLQSTYVLVEGDKINILGPGAVTSDSVSEFINL